MRLHIIIAAGLLAWAPLSHAEPPTPEQTVERLLHANHGFGELASKELLETWEEVRRNPQPYLPSLRAWVTWERIEAATEQEEIRGIRNAIGLLAVLGEDGRALLVTRLKQLHQKRDELSAWEKGQRSRFASLTESEKAFFKAQAKRIDRLIFIEDAILRSFREAGDSRLRDTLLPRLGQDSDMRDRYIDYFEATGRKDPVVQAKLKKMLDTPLDPLTEERLRRFLNGP